MMGIPLKQGNAQFFFNPLKLLVQPGLGDKQFVCGLGDTAAFCNGQYIIQLPCIHNVDTPSQARFLKIGLNLLFL